MIRRRRHSPAERPDEFDLNLDSLLADRLVFAGLARFPNTLHYHDSSLYGNTGTLNGFALSGTTSNWITGIGRAALDFDGTGDYVDLGTKQFLNTALPFTVATWINVDQLQYSAGSNYITPFEVKTNDSENWRIGRSDSASYADWFFGAAGATWYRGKFSGGTTVDVWQHLTITYNGAAAATGTSYASYVNGVAAAITNSDAFASHTGNGFLSYNADLQRLDGALADVAIWQRALTQPEIDAISRPDNVMYELGGNPLLRYRPSRSVVYVSSAPAAGSPWLYGLRSSRVIGGGTL